MRIALTSDIHTDFSPSNRQIVKYLVDVAEHTEPDVLIICGDISPNIYTFTETLNAFHAIKCKKLFVAGNHDIWIASNTDKVTSYQKYSLITKICEEIGFHHLGDSSFVAGNIGFCGTIGWYDYTYKSDKYAISDNGYEKKIYQGSVWNDVNFAKWKLSDKKVSAGFEADLQDQINGIKDKVSRIIVATHHVPFKECVKYRDELQWDYFSAFMGSYGLGQICFNEPLVTHTFFGHSHIAFSQGINPKGYTDLTRPNIQAICSPIGYLTDPPDDLYLYAKKMLKIIEITE